MAGYTRQSTFADGDTITAALFNNEYNQLLNAFSNTGGHKHDGTANEGPVIGLIGDAGETSPNNKVLIDTTNNYIEFYVEVSSAPVQQLYIADGAIIPVTDSDIDLGTTSLRFKDTYTDTVTTTGNVSIGGDLTVTGSATISGNLTFGDADTDSINLSAEIDSDIIPNTDGTYDLGSATKEWQDLYIDGTANIDSLVADTADINGGTIDGATIATSDITVGAGKTLNVSAGTLTLADNQISGDKVEGGTIAATTITTLTSTTGNITNVNATTVDSTNIEVTNLKAKDGTSAGSIANTTGVVTLASSVLTTTDINGGTIDGVTIGGTTAGAVTFTDLSDGTITIAGFADEDNMVSNSATLLPTQQSVKAYVDSQVTAQDLDFQGDTGGALSIDLDSESLTISGGTGIDTSGATNTLTVAIDSTVATLTGTQTLTNKTLTSATLTSPVINTGVSGTAFLDDDTFATATATTLASSESIKAYVDTTVAATNEVVEDTTPQLGGDLDTNGNDILFGDNDKAIFGASDDLQIYHDGSNSYIYDEGVGNLYIDATNLSLRKGGGLESYVECLVNGEVGLFHDGIKKLATTSTGIDVTGTATMDGLTVDGSIDFANAIDGVINAPFSCFINIDSNNNSTGDIFVVGRNATGTTSAKMFEVRESGDISFYDDTGTSQALFWDASAESLGIGTTSPSAPLDIKLNTNSTADIFKFQRLDGAVAGVLNYSGTDGAISLGTTTSHDLTFDTANTERMRIDSSGNVGIGTDSPAYKLSLADTTQAGTTVQLFRTGSAAGSMFINGGLAFGADGGNGDTQRMVISSSTGNVGIGTTSPSGELHVKSSSGFAEVYVQGSTSSSGMYLFDKGIEAGLWKVDSGYLAFGTTNAERMRIDSSGNVGIGRTPTQKLDVNGVIRVSDGTFGGYFGAGSALAGGATTDFVLRSDNVLSFASGGPYERMRIDSSGNVGIGTAGPSYKLTVQEAIDTYAFNIRDTIGNERVLIGSRATAPIDNITPVQIANDNAGNLLLSSRTNIASGIKFYSSAGTTAIERMRIDSSGNLLVGATAIESTSGFDVNPYSGGIKVNIGHNGSAANGDTYIAFRRTGTALGSITQVSSTGVAYNTTSDARLKDVTGSARGLEVINELNPVAYNWKADNKADEGLIAQEVMDIVPNAVSGSEEDMYQMDYSKLVVHLVAGMKEQQAQIEALQSEINELKNS